MMISSTVCSLLTNGQRLALLCVFGALLLLTPVAFSHNTPTGLQWNAVLADHCVVGDHLADGSCSTDVTPPPDIAPEDEGEPSDPINRDIGCGPGEERKSSGNCGPIDPNSTRADGAQEGSNTGDTTTGILGSIANFVMQMIYGFFMVIPVTLASIAGILLNNAIQYLVFGMGQLITFDSGIGFAINQLWQVVRDVLNIGFIFALIYIGIKTILNSEDSNTRRALGLLIAAALLINFSLFIAKVIVDFTNYLASMIFTLMTGGEAVAEGGFLAYYGISGAFFHAVGASSLSTGVNLDQYVAAAGGGIMSGFGTFVAQLFMAMILFLVLAVVFTAGAIMLFTRFVALILYMIFSPVMFMGWILPFFKKFADQWWDGFFKQAFFAPAFLFMLYIALLTTQQIRLALVESRSGSLTNDNSFHQAFTGNINAFSIVLVYGFAIGMLVASIVVAQRMSIVGSGTTMGVLKGMRNSAQSFAGRNTAGVLGRQLQRATLRMEESRLGRNINRGLTLASMGTIDTRTRMEAGKALANNKFGGSRSHESDVAYNTERKQRIAKADTKKAFQNSVKQYQSDIAAGKDEGDVLTAELRENILNADIATIEKLSDTERASIAHILSSSQIGELLKSTELDNKQKASLGTARKQKLVQTFTETSNGKTRVIGSGLSNATLDQLETLGEDFLAQHAQALSNAQMQELKKSKKYTEGQINKIAERRDQKIDNWIGQGNMGAKQIFESYEGKGTYKVKKPAEIARLPKAALLSPGAVPYLNSGVLEQIFDQKTLTPAERGKLRRKLEAPNSGAPADALEYFNSPLGTRNWAK